MAEAVARSRSPRVPRALLAPLRRRGAARLLDWTAMAGIALAVRAVIPSGSAWRWAVLAVPLLYEVVPTSWWGQTLGKHLLGVRVVALRTMAPPTAARSAVRYLVWAGLGYVSVTRPFAPLWWALVFGSLLLSLEFQGVHDAMAGTVVVRADR